MNNIQLKGLRQLADLSTKQKRYKIVVGKSCKVFDLDYNRAVEYAKYYIDAQIVEQ